LPTLAVTIVNPSRIYGPGQLTESNAATKLIKRCYEGKWRILPGNGESMGNYVYIDDVVQGHLQAMQYGQSGHRYILGGENVSFKEFFGLIRELSPHNKRLYKLPVPIMMGFAQSQLLMAEWFGRHPLIIPAFVRKYNYHWNLSSQKAIQELGYQITPLRQGVMQTIEWFNQNQYERV
jgi:nucleoside-diphosphate-sugar epimerase